MAKLEESKKKWTEVYNCIATDDQKGVQIKELKAFISGKEDLEDCNIADIFRDIDTDGDQTITLDEFVTEMSKNDRNTAFSQLFDDVDTDRNECLSAGEIKELCQRLQYFTDDEIDGSLSQCDSNEDGKITKQEFLKYMNA